jgi:hypothetical protein
MIAAAMIERVPGKSGKAAAYRLGGKTDHRHHKKL